MQSPLPLLPSPLTHHSPITPTVAVPVDAAVAAARPATQHLVAAANGFVARVVVAVAIAVVHAAAIVDAVAAVVARVVAVVVPAARSRAVDDARVGRRVAARGGAIGRARLSPRWDTVDPNPTHSGRRHLARRDARRA